MLSSESPSSSSLEEGSHMPLPCFEVLPRLTSSLGPLGLFCMSLAGMNSIPFCTQSSSKAQKWAVSSRLCQNYYLQRNSFNSLATSCVFVPATSVRFHREPRRPWNTHWGQDTEQTWHWTSSRTRICWQLPEPHKMLPSWRCCVTFSERSFKGEHHNWQRCHEDHVVCRDPKVYTKNV